MSVQPKLLVALLLLAIAPALPCSGEDLNRRLEKAGLEIAWRNQVIQPRFGRPPASVVVYPDPVKRKQILTVRLDGKIIEQFDGDQIDQDAWEQMMVGATSEMARDSVGKMVPPKLGLEGARKKAEEIAKRLAKLGRQVSIDPPIDRQMIYLVIASENGAIQTFDAETGDMLWTTYIGTPNFPTLAVGVNEGYVSGINGSDLYLLRLDNGKIIEKRSLNQTPGGGAVVAGNRIYVTNVDGSLVGHNLRNRADYPWQIKTGGFSPFEPVISLDDSFIAWVAAPEYVFFAKLGEKPQIWNRFQSQDEIACNPTPIKDAFIITTTGGSIIKIGLPNAESPVTRDNSMLWRFNSGSPIRQSAYAGGSTIYVTFVDSHMIGLDTETGLPKWDEPKIGIRSVIASSDDRVFALTLDQHIDIIDGATGKTIDSILAPQGHFHSNYVDDRIYFIGNDGQLVCIHDKAAVEARFHQQTKQATGAKPNAAAKPAEKPAESTEQSSESDPFGESPFGGEASGGDAPAGDAQPDNEDPFGGG